jgi:hypothetical protein
MRKIIGTRRLPLASSLTSRLLLRLTSRPAGVDLVNPLSCDNYGSITMVADPARPSDLFTQFNCQGVWKSVDYGLT